MKTCARESLFPALALVLLAWQVAQHPALAQVTSVTASPPVVSSGGTAPNISLPGVRIDTLSYGNAAVGQDTLLANTTGIGNTAMGQRVLRSNTNGERNVGVGVDALLSNTSGILNSATGAYALYHNTTGNLNTAVGGHALESNSTGVGNTAAGGRALWFNTTGVMNAALGASALQDNTTGYNNTAVGAMALFNNVTGNYLTAIGFQARVTTDGLTNATAIGSNAEVDASHKIRLGDTRVTVIEGQVPYTWTSDAGSKENLKPVNGEEVLQKLRGLTLTSWNYIGHDPKRLRHYGPMAQDFFAAFGHDGVGSIGTPKTISAGDISGVLMIMAQALEMRTAELQAENASLKSRLERLERLISSDGLK